MIILRVVLLGSWLLSAVFGAPMIQQPPPPPQTPDVDQRLVVFEGFFLYG